MGHNTFVPPLLPPPPPPYDLRNPEVGGGGGGGMAGVAIDGQQREGSELGERFALPEL